MKKSHKNLQQRVEVLRHAARSVNMNPRMQIRILIAVMTMALLASPVMAATAREIDVSIDEALKVFYREVQGGQGFLAGSRGYIVFPKVIKAGLGIGGEYGEGALRTGGRTVEYYSTAAASVGFQLGIQKKSVIIVFMEKGALKRFRDSDGWEVGVDGSVALIKVGAGGSIDTTNIKSPVAAFIFGQKGLMYNLTLEGSKFTKIKR